jgi:ANTAR domain
MDPGSGDVLRLDAEFLQALWLESRALRQLAAETRARVRVTRDQIRRGRSQREVLHESAFARLQAKMGTTPLLEQAKGIIMDQRRCGSEEAFDLLREASQRTNVKLHVLAAQIVGEVASSNDRDNVTPISVGARSYLRPGVTWARHWPGY